MRSFLDQLFRDQEPYLFSFADVLLAMSVSALLSYILATVYRLTHRGTTYSQTFVHTLFLMSVATSVVMMIIGSNIARAFSLVGALSIIRFRTAVKDARDTGFLFAAMVAGMGCGTQFYMPAIAFTAFVAGLMLVLDRWQLGRKSRPDQIVRISFRDGDGPVKGIEAALGESFREVRLLNRLLDMDEGQRTHVYAARARARGAPAALERALEGVEGVGKVAVYEREASDAE